MHSMTKEKPFLLSFGRRVGKAMGDGKKHVLKTLLPELSLTLNTQNDAPIQPQEWFSNPVQDVWMEIGFGGGEFLEKQVELHQDIGFIGCEPFINGVASFLYAMRKKNRSNIRLWVDDARLLLQNIESHSLGRVYILFPDPWPKRRHHKRRLISTPMLDLLAEKIRKGGELILATDHQDYAAWMLEHLEAHERFDWKSESHKNGDIPPDHWSPTRYEQKMRIQGYEPVFMHFVRNST